MKKGPNLRWSLIQCSGGDEGDRTPDLLTASQALSQLSYAPVRRSTIRELPRRCKDIFGKLSPMGCGAPIERAGPHGAEGPAMPAGRAPPCARRPFRRRRSHYRARSRFRPPGHLKTMPDYGARPGTPEHAGISGNKTAGGRLAHFIKCRVWTAGLGSAP